MTEKARNAGPASTQRTTTAKTPPPPEGFQPADATTPGDPGPADATTEERAARLQAKVDASPLEAAPEDQTGPTGGSFYNPATVGSGTIMPDGTYGSPLPDPNVARLAKAHEEANGGTPDDGTRTAK